MNHGIFDYPQWYPAPLSPASSFEDFQAFMHREKPELCPKPCEAAMLPSYGESCVSRAVKLDFFHSTLAHRNLGGLGPDAGDENMRYQNVGNRTVRVGDVLQTMPFDLVVTATGDYQYHNQGRSGLSGSYGVVNLKAPSATTLTFSFEDSATGEPVVLEAFHFSIFDVDQSNNAHERMLIGGFERYTADPETEVGIEDAADGRTLFKSTQLGAGCDNPRDPLQLGEVTCRGRTVDQRKRAVTLLFSEKSSFEVSLEATCSARKCGGRNFLFSGSSSLSYTCEEAVRPGLCAAFGDPHFVTFDGAQTVFLGHQLLWLVRSEEVRMQALSKDSDGKLTAFAVGGPFMQNHTLTVRKTTAFTLEASFDGAAILSEAVSEFHEAGVVDAYRRKAWNATLHSEDILAVRTQMRFAVGPWPERFLREPVGGLYLLKLPGGVEVTITGADIMSVVITMPPQSGGQGGYCGNFNGDAADDFEPVGPSFHKAVGSDLEAVSPSEALLNSSWWQPGQAGDAPQLDPERVMDDCSVELKAVAEGRCRVVTDAQMKEDCIFDVCATGVISAADGVLAAEILEEKVNARGIPLFMGHGQCLDTVREPYMAFNTTLGTADACTDVLRSLVLTSGVLGAQLHRDATCQILVENGTDPTQVQIRGGWGPMSNELAHGHGIISDTTEEEGWSCWQVV